MSYQTVAEVKLAPHGDTLVDYSLNVSRLSINVARTDRDVPATYGAPDEATVAGPKRYTVSIEYNADYDHLSLWSMLLDTAINGDGAVDFQIKYVDAAVGVDNPKYTGTFDVTDIDIGAAVNEYFQQSKTYRARDLVMVTA